MSSGGSSSSISKANFSLRFVGFIFLCFFFLMFFLSTWKPITAGFCVIELDEMEKNYSPLICSKMFRDVLGKFSKAFSWSGFFLACPRLSPGLEVRGSLHLWRKWFPCCAQVVWRCNLPDLISELRSCVGQWSWDVFGGEGGVYE